MSTKTFLSSTELDSVLEAFTDSDIDAFGVKGFIISFTPLLFNMNELNQLLTTISSILGIIWLAICITYKIKDRKKTALQEDEDNE